MSQGYNGWTNRATWLVNVWCEPQSRQDLEAIRYQLEEQYDEMPDGPLKDMVCLDEVDWDQLAEHFDDEDEVEEDEDADPGEMDGDEASALASVGWGTDEDYGSASDGMY